MRSAGPLDPSGIAALESIDIGEILEDCGVVTLLFILLVPLIMVVKNEGDDVVEIIDKAVW